MNKSLANFLNPVLRVFGLKITRLYMGHWSTNPITGKIQRHSIPMGWRLSTRSEWKDLPENATALDLLLKKSGRPTGKDLLDSMNRQRREQ